MMLFRHSRCGGAVLVSQSFLAVAGNIAVDFIVAGAATAIVAAAAATTATGASEEGLARGGTGRAVLSPPGFGGADGGIGRVLGGGLQVLIVAAQAAHHVLGGAGASNGGLNET